MSDVNRVSVRVIPNTKGFREDVKRMLERIEHSYRLVLNVDADTKKATRDLERVARERDATVQADADTAKAEAQLDEVSRNRRVKIHLDLGSGGKLLAKLATARVGFLTTGGIAAITAAVAAVTPLLALAAPLPGILAGSAVGVGTLAVALSDAKKQLKSLLPMWKNLKETIQSNFWAKAKAPILELAQNLLPDLKKGLGDVSDALGVWAKSVAKSFGVALSHGRLAGMMDDLSKSIRNATKGTGAFADAVAVLGTFGAKYLPDIGDWFSDITIRFDKWISKVASDGTLAGWVQDGMRVLHDLGSVAKSVVGIVAGIGKAARAAGSDGLSGFAKILHDISDVVNSPGVQKGLTAIFKAVGAVAKALGGVLGQALITVAPLIVDLSKAVTPLIPKLGKALVKALVDLTPSFVSLVEAITPILPQLVQLAVDTLPGVTQAAIILIPALVWLLGVVQKMLTPLVNFGDFMAEGQRVLQGLVSPAQFASDALNGKFGPALQFAMSLIGKTRDIAQTLIDKFNAVVSGVQNAAQGVRTWIGKIPVYVQDAVAGAGSWLVDTGKQIIHGLIEGIRKAIGGIKDILRDVTNLIPSWKGPASVDRVLLKPAGEMIMHSLVTGLKNGIGEVERTLGGVTTSIPRVATGYGDLGSGATVTINSPVVTSEGTLVGLIKGVAGQQIGLEFDHQEMRRAMGSRL